MCGQLVDRNQDLEEQIAATPGAKKLAPVGMTIIANLDNPSAHVQVLPTTIPG